MYLIRQLVLFPFLVSFYSEEILSFDYPFKFLFEKLLFQFSVRLENKMASLLEHQEIVLQTSAILNISSNAS